MEAELEQLMAIKEKLDQIEKRITTLESVQKQEADEIFNMNVNILRDVDVLEDKVGELESTSRLHTAELELAYISGLLKPGN